MNSQTAQMTGESIAVRPVHAAPAAPGLGAEILGADLRTIDDAAFAAIHRAWIDHQVLLFRGQNLTDHDLIAFSRRFGDLDHAPIQENGQSIANGMPEIYVVSKCHRKRCRDRQSRLWRGGVAHGYVLPDRSAQGEHALRAGNSTRRRGYVVRRHVRRVRGTAGIVTASGDGAAGQARRTYNSGGYVRQGVTPNQ